MDPGTEVGPESSFHDADVLSSLAVIPYDERVAERWGELQAFARLRGRPRPVNDSWIAAACLVRELPLATFNVKDFADFAAHEGLDLYPTE